MTIDILTLFPEIATKMRNMRIPVPHLAERLEIVAKIERQESVISAAQAIISCAPARKGRDPRKTSLKNHASA